MADMEREHDRDSTETAAGNGESASVKESVEAENSREASGEESAKAVETDPEKANAEEAEASEGEKPEETDASEEEAEASQTDSGDSSNSDAEDSKKSIFRKKEKKKDKSAEQIADLNDKLRRQMAEFDNFRKRTEREKNQMFEIGAKSVVEKILPVVDSFERGLNAIPEEAKEDPYVQGMDKIYRQLMTELENLGVKAIEAVGQEFNPDFHNAVMQVENDELESGTVAQELQKGYMYRDSVVRHSMVSVVQ